MFRPSATLVRPRLLGLRRGGQGRKKAASTSDASVSTSLRRDAGGTRLHNVRRRCPRRSPPKKASTGRRPTHSSLASESPWIGGRRG